MLEHHSGYFRGALSGARKESEGVVTLEDVEPGIFNVFAEWLYSGRLPEGTDDWERMTGIDRCGEAILKACCLGDRLLAPKFRALANNTWVNDAIECEWCPIYNQVIYAFENLPKSYPLLTFLADMQCYHWSPVHDGDDEELRLRDHLPNDFLVRVMLKYESMKAEKRDDWPGLEACSYYEHLSDAEKMECKQMAEKA